MIPLVKFPIFHHYLSAILLRIGLAEESYTHTFNAISSYSVTDYCNCGDPCCSTVYLQSDTLKGKDGAFANPFNIAWVIINFYPDGKMEIENIADKIDDNFPFREEIRTVSKGETLDYGDTYAEAVVEAFMKKLVKQAAHKIEV